MAVKAAGIDESALTHHIAAMSVGARVLHESPTFRVERLAFGAIVKVTRLKEPFETWGSVDLACRPVQLALDREGRAGLAILVDTREAIGRNDPASEEAFALHRREMILGFRRAAILVRTPTGLLQLRRLLQVDATAGVAQVFLDEQEAMTYLAGADPSSP